MKKNYGFTLIELLIAASIFSVVILSIYSAFQTGILSYRKVDSAFETYQTARIALNRMELDLKNSFAYGDTEGSRFSGKEDSLDFFSVVDYYRDKLNTDICRIKYEWDENKKVLKRFCYMGLDALKEDLQQEAGELASNIEKISFEYAFATNNPDNPYIWQKSWPEGDTAQIAQQVKTIPLAVKVTLFVIEKGKPGKVKSIEFNKTISLPLGETTPVEGGT